MIVLGGSTRLTGSGLSITEWKPFLGILPPLNHKDWVELFEKYQHTPEFQHINYTFSLKDFQSIFWLEYIHRLWGRLLGIPLLILSWQAYRHPLWKAFYKKRILLLWAFGGLQGLMGWIMVKSGLHQQPHVSPFKLSLHLMVTAMIIFILFSCLRNNKTLVLRKPLSFHITFVLVILTLLYGGLVAGHKAGLIYNTFPQMNGQWIPEDTFSLAPLWKNFFENATTVQFIHRIFATLSLIAMVYTSIVCLRERGLVNIAFGIMLISLAVIQYSLGIITLLTHVNIEMGVLHQLTAFMIFGLLSWGFWHRETRKSHPARIA